MSAARKPEVREVAIVFPIGAVVVTPDARVLRVAWDGELVAVVQGGHPHGEMATEPVATRRMQ